MKIKVVIAGSRNYTNYESAEEFIDICLMDLPPDTKSMIEYGKKAGKDIRIKHITG